jgi:hypothetical protein
MITGLKVNLEGEDYFFTETGSVILASTNSAVGRWSSGVEGRRVNEIAYNLDGVDQSPLKANYAFNDRNQLVVQVPKGSGVTAEASYVFPGAIVVDDENDIEYQLLNEQGAPAGQSVYVFGSLRFDSPLQLVIDLVEGRQTMIRSSDSAAPVEADGARSAGSQGRDRLVFKASTTNSFVIDGQSVLQVAEADIGFDGRWELGDLGLKFVCTGEVGDDGQAMTFSLSGKYKAVSAGLEVTWNSATGVQGTFVIEGRNEFDSTTSTWKLSVGYTQRKNSATAIVAKAQGKITHKTKGGRDFVIEGKLEVQSGGGAATQIDLGLDVSYEFKDGKITFSAVTQWAGGRLTYELKLGGEIRIGPGTLKFAIRYSSDNTIELDVQYQGDDKSFLKFFQFQLKRDKKGRVDIKVTVRIECTYVNGRWQAGPPQKLA